LVFNLDFSLFYYTKYINGDLHRSGVKITGFNAVSPQIPQIAEIFRGISPKIPAKPAIKAQIGPPLPHFARIGSIPAGAP